MTNYLKHERKLLEQQIREFYTKSEKYLSVEMLSTPLRELTYEGKSEGVGGSVHKILASMVDDYIHKYHVSLKKDITLGKAIRKII